MAERIYLYDSTLRDGAQARGIDFTAADKYAIAEARPTHLLSLTALGWALLREWSGESEFERSVRPPSTAVAGAPFPLVAPESRAASGARCGKAWADSVEDRYRHIRRCC